MPFRFTRVENASGMANPTTWSQINLRERADPVLDECDTRGVAFGAMEAERTSGDE